MSLSLFIISTIAMAFAIVGLTIVLKKCETQKINIACEQEFLNKKLNISRRIILKDTRSVNSDEYLYSKLILVDEKKEKIGLIDYDNKTLYIANYSDIINYNIYENEDKITVGTNITKNVYSGRTQNESTSLKLLITINNKSNPQITYEMIEHDTVFSNLNKTSDKYETCRSSLNKACAYLDIILNEKKVTEKTIYCTYCGAKNKASDNQCVACGSRFTKN